MKTIGVIATVVVAVIAVGTLGLAVLSIPDIRRYLAMRKM